MNVNNTEKFNKLRKLFAEYEALAREKNLRIYDIQKLRIPGGLKENYVKDYKAVVDPKIEKVADDIMRIVNEDGVTFVTGLEGAIDDGEEDWVKVKFRSDRQPDLHIVMSMTEFFEQVEKQLGAGLPAPSYITPNPVAIAPLLNPYKDGPSDKVEMP